MTSDLARTLQELVRTTCEARPTDVEPLAQRLGVSLAAGWRSYADVDRPPAGIASIRIGLDGDRGPVRFLEIALAGDVSVALDELAAEWRDPQLYEPDDVGDPERFIYEVALDESRRACRVAVDVRPETGDGPRLVSGLEVLP